MTDKIISCPQCGFPRIRDVGNGLYQCDDCGTHFDKDENVVLTNEEWFCGLSTEEKADLMSRIVDCSNCHIPKDGRSCMGTYSGCWHEIIKWLKQPHTNS